MATIPNLADLQYSGFYIPIFTLAYIREQFILPVELPLPVLEIAITPGNFGFFFSVAVLGALVEHGINRAIFGPGGAIQNPKNPWVVRWHKILFLFKPSPGLFPESREHLQEKVDNSAKALEGYTAVKKAKFVFLRATRTIVFGGGVILFTTLVFLLTAFLLIEGYNGSLSYLGLILLVSQTVFFFGSKILGRFASVVNPDSAPWIFVPEYKKAQMLKEQKRIQFEYDPRGFFEAGSWLLDKEANGSKDKEGYLIPLDDRANTSYLVPLSEED